MGMNDGSNFNFHFTGHRMQARERMTVGKFRADARNAALPAPAASRAFPAIIIPVIME